MSQTTIDQLVERLRAIAADPAMDRESEHMAADEALLDFIGIRAVEDAYNAIKKWYA